MLSGHDVGRVVAAIEERLAADARLGMTESHNDCGSVAMLNVEPFSGTSYRMMTSLTTWSVLMPMAIGLGGSGTNAPLAHAIIGGVIGATVLSLVVVPCLYVMLKREPDDSTSEPVVIIIS